MKCAKQLFCKKRKIINYLRKIFPFQNFRQEEPRFNEQPVPFFPPQNNQNSQLPVEVNDPGVLKAPAPLAQEPREQFAVPPPPPNHFFENNFLENREPEFVEENRAFRPLTVDVRPRGQRREPIANTLMPEISKIIPLNFERRPVDNGRKIRFPEIIESEEVRENRMPIITEITKIIPIRLEKEEPELRDSPILPLNPNVPPKNMDIPEIKLEKIPPRPFPIPINAILDMIFKGIRPLMGNRGHPFPIPIDIKIERIENKPLGFMGPPFLKKFEIIKKEESSLEEKSPNSQLEEEKNENENEENDDNEKEMVEAKVERVEVFDRENENGQAIPIPADAQDPQVYKLEEQEKQPEANEQSSFEDQAFLPNGQGRGARVFPIPQLFKEADIFSVFDAKPDKNAEPEVEIAEAPVESSINVANVDNERALEGANNRQGRVLNFPNPILNFFPIQGEKIMKPIIMKPEPLNFAPESRLLKLYPVSDAGMKNEEMKPQVADANMEETRPHCKCL